MRCFIIFLNEHVLEVVVRRSSAKKVFLYFTKFTAQRKRDSVTVIWMLWNFGDTFYNRTPPVVASFLLNRPILHFLSKWQNFKNFTNLVPSQTLSYDLQNLIQKQSPDVFYKKVVPRNFAKFLGKHLCQSLFFKITLRPF